MPRTCPRLVHTVRRTALGPKDGSTSSLLGAAVVAVVLSAPRWNQEEKARAGRPRRATAGAASIRFGHTGEQYVRARAWRDARLSRCPNHPQGRCSFARHGTYARKSPRGTRIARWYCPESHTTFSLLPDCLSARLGSRPRALCLRPLFTASVIALPPFALPASPATPR